MKQPIWRITHELGDVDWMKWDGYFVFEDQTGGYPTEAEWAETPPIPWDENEKEEEPKWMVYRFVLEKCTFINGILSDNKYHPDYEVWFGPNSGNSFQRIACYLDKEPEEFAQMFCSDDVCVRAEAYRKIYEYHGWNEADSYPLHLTEWEMKVKYRELEKKRLGLEWNTPDLMCADRAAEMDLLQLETLFRLAESKMDPTANLQEQLEIAQRRINTGAWVGDNDRLAELVLALHDWLSKGGFPPRQWKGLTVKE